MKTLILPYMYIKESLILLLSNLVAKIIWKEFYSSKKKMKASPIYTYQLSDTEYITSSGLLAIHGNWTK